jgi:hypothetical protein
LNEKYGGGFYLFFRTPAFSKQDERYMGWERKRGALTELVRLLARLELGDAIPEALYRTIAEIIAFAWHLKGKCPEGFAPDAADGNQMLLLGGPGD